MPNYPFLPYPVYCPDCGQPIPQGQTCPCYAGSVPSGVSRPDGEPFPPRTTDGGAA